MNRSHYVGSLAWSALIMLCDPRLNFDIHTLYFQHIRVNNIISDDIKDL